MRHFSKTYMRSSYPPYSSVLSPVFHFISNKLIAFFLLPSFPSIWGKLHMMDPALRVQTSLPTGSIHISVAKEIFCPSGFWGFLWCSNFRDTGHVPPKGSSHSLDHRFSCLHVMEVNNSYLPTRQVSSTLHVSRPTSFWSASSPQVWLVDDGWKISLGFDFKMSWFGPWRMAHLKCSWCKMARCNDYFNSLWQ